MSKKLDKHGECSLAAMLRIPPSISTMVYVRDTRKRKCFQKQAPKNHRYCEDFPRIGCVVCWLHFKRQFGTRLPLCYRESFDRLFAQVPVASNVYIFTLVYIVTESSANFVIYQHQSSLLSVKILFLNNAPERFDRCSSNFNVRVGCIPSDTPCRRTFRVPLALWSDGPFLSIIRYFCRHISRV